MPELVTISIPLIGALTFVALIIFAAAVVQDSKDDRRPSMIRRGYVYLVSFASLLLVAASLIHLADLGLRTWAFKDAGLPTNYREAPPALFLTSKIHETPSGDGALTCNDTCPLTDQDRTEIATWASQYKDWQDRQGTTSVRAQSLVNGLSFLIVAGIVFLIHWRMLRRDVHEVDEAKNMTRSAYFTSVSFIALALIIIFGSLFVNTTLRTFIPGAAQKTSSFAQPVAAPVSAITASLPACATTCNLDADTVALAQQWQVDNEQWAADTQRGFNTTQDEFARDIAFLLIAIPLFAFHFRTVWRERKQNPTTT